MGCTLLLHGCWLRSVAGVQVSHRLACILASKATAAAKARHQLLQALEAPEARAGSQLGAGSEHAYGVDAAGEAMPDGEGDGEDANEQGVDGSGVSHASGRQIGSRQASSVSLQGRAQRLFAASMRRAAQVRCLLEDCSRYCCTSELLLALDAVVWVVCDVTLVRACMVVVQVCISCCIWDMPPSASTPT
jgi:hypothetical protein